MENPIKIDDLGVPLLLETPIWLKTYYIVKWNNRCIIKVLTYPLTVHQIDPIAMRLTPFASSCLSESVLKNHVGYNDFDLLLASISICKS